MPAAASPTDKVPIDTSNHFRTDGLVIVSCQKLLFHSLNALKAAQRFGSPAEQCRQDSFTNQSDCGQNAPRTLRAKRGQVQPLLGGFSF
jgi:hypothetical protein